MDIRLGIVGVAGLVCMVLLLFGLPDATAESSWEIEKQLGDHADWTNSGAWSPDGALLATGGNDQKLYVYRSSDWLQVEDLDISAPYPVLGWSGNGAYLAVGAGTHLAVYDTSTWSVFKSFEQHEGGITQVRFMDDDRYIVTSSHDGKVLFLDTMDWTFEIDSIDVGVDISDFSISPDGDEIATLLWSGNNSLLVWDTDTLAHKKTIPDLGYRPNLVAYSPDGRHILAGTESGMLYVWDPDTWSEVLERDMSDECRWTDWHPDSRYVAVAFRDLGIKLFDSEDWLVVATLTGHDDVYGQVQWSPDGTLLSSASNDQTFIIYRVVLDPTGNVMVLDNLLLNGETYSASIYLEEGYTFDPEWTFHMFRNTVDIKIHDSSGSLVTDQDLRFDITFRLLLWALYNTGDIDSIEVDLYTWNRDDIFLPTRNDWALNAMAWVTIAADFIYKVFDTAIGEMAIHLFSDEAYSRQQQLADIYQFFMDFCLFPDKYIDDRPNLKNILVEHNIARGSEAMTSALILTKIYEGSPEEYEALFIEIYDEVKGEGLDDSLKTEVYKEVRRQVSSAVAAGTLSFFKSKVASTAWYVAKGTAATGMKQLITTSGVFSFLLGWIIDYELNFLSNTYEIVGGIFQICDLAMVLENEFIEQVNFASNWDMNSDEALDLDAAYLGFYGRGVDMENLVHLFELEIRLYEHGLNGLVYQGKADELKPLVEGWKTNIRCHRDFEERLKQHTWDLVTQVGVSEVEIEDPPTKADVCYPEGPDTEYSIQVVAHSPIFMNLSSASGDYVTFDMGTNTVDTNMDYCIYSGPFVEPQIIIVYSDLSIGEYDLAIIGTDEGEFTIVTTILGGGSQLVNDTVTGTTSSGEVHRRTIIYDVSQDEPEVDVPPALPDLRIGFIQTDRSKVTKGRFVTMSALLENAGWRDSGPFTAVFKLENGDVLGFVDVGNIAPGEDRTISFEWQARKTGSHEITVEVDPGNKVDEIEENNNMKSSGSIAVVKEKDEPFIPSFGAVQTFIVTSIAFILSLTRRRHRVNARYQEK